MLSESDGERRARYLGRIAQALGLAALLAAAVGKLILNSGTTVVFRYQGF